MWPLPYAVLLRWLPTHTSTTRLRRPHPHPSPTPPQSRAPDKAAALFVLATLKGYYTNFYPALLHCDADRYIETWALVRCLGKFSDPGTAAGVRSGQGIKLAHYPVSPPVSLYPVLRIPLSHIPYPIIPHPLSRYPVSHPSPPPPPPSPPLPSPPPPTPPPSPPPPSPPPSASIDSASKIQIDSASN